METIKNFIIFKNSKKEKDNHPDYRISIKVGNDYVDGGGVWLKEGKSGKFFSCKLNDARDLRVGFGIHVEKAPFTEVKREDIDVSQIPF